MELTQLRYVLQLASTSNFSKAADRLYITQPALSQQINVLEEELGLKLFRRTTRKVTLTEAGEEFVLGAQEVLDRVEKLQRTMALRRREVGGTLSVGLLSTLSHLNITEYISSFRKVYPNIHIDLQVAWSSELINRVLDRELDAAITNIHILPGNQLDSRLNVHFFLEDSIMMMASLKRNFGGQETVEVRDLSVVPMIEQAAIKALQERHDYDVLNCMTAAPDTLPDGTGRKDKKQVVLPDVMFERLCRINPDIPEQTVRTVVDELCRTPVSGDLMLTNYQNYQKIRNGITVEYNKNGKKTSNILRLLSYNDALSNTFTVASQMWIKGETHWRRPDLIIFINGFPMVFIELKNSNIPVKNAYDINLKNYLKDIPYLFNYNQICVLSNGMETRLGSFAAGYEFFFEWLKVENEKENPDRKAIRENCTSLEYFIAGLCEPKNLLDYCR